MSLWIRWDRLKALGDWRKDKGHLCFLYFSKGYRMPPLGRAQRKSELFFINLK